jgi:hypothetical protein
MSGIKISDLPAADAALGAMQLEVNDAGTSRRVTVDQVLSDSVLSVVVGITGASVVTNVVAISQADYDAITTPDSTTLYVITE